MAKGILEFELPEEREDFETAQNGWKYKSILKELDEDLRRKLKYENHPPEARKIFEEMRAYLNTEAREQNVEL